MFIILNYKFDSFIIIITSLLLDNFIEKDENFNDKFFFTFLDITFAYLILEMLTRQASPFHCSLTIRCKF